MRYKEMVQAYGVSVLHRKSEYYILNKNAHCLCIRIAQMLGEEVLSEEEIRVEPNERILVDLKRERYRLSFEDKVLYFDNNDWGEKGDWIDVLFGIVDLLTGNYST